MFEVKRAGMKSVLSVSKSFGTSFSKYGLQGIFETLYEIKFGACNHNFGAPDGRKQTGQFLFLKTLKIYFFLEKFL